jgi:hypothetical protein
MPKIKIKQWWRGDEPISATTHERGGRFASIKNFTCLEEFPDGPRDARHTQGKHRYRFVQAVIPTIAYCLVRVGYSVYCLPFTNLHSVETNPAEVDDQRPSLLPSHRPAPPSRQTESHILGHRHGPSHVRHWRRS